MNFYIFNNGIMTEDAISGCEQRILNWLPLFSSKAESITVVTSKQGAVRFVKMDKVKVLVTTSLYLKSLCGLFVSYLTRAIQGCLINRSIYMDKNEENIIYSASDLIADSIPALFLKMKNKRARLVIGVHLLAPLPWKGFRKFYLKSFCMPTLAGIYYFLSQTVILKIARRYASLILVSNHIDRDALIRKGFQLNKVLVAYGGIDLQVTDKVEVKETLYEACYVGRFHQQKGFIDLIEIWARVIRRFSSAKLVVIGYDINLKQMKDKVKKRNLENNILFQGFVGGKDKIRLIKSSKLSVVPSYYESFNMVILEAMACGIPVVAYKLPVYQDIYIQGIKMVDIGNKEEFAEVIVDLLENEQERTELVKQAKELSKNFSWKKTANEILARLKG